jgi:predicted short-subunit dehydrogenase-like oxidoreductase (DUF2520 family)
MWTDVNRCTTVFIGAGNLAGALASAMQQAGFPLLQVYSRTAASASALADRIGCGWTDSLAAVRDDAELYIFAVRDEILESVIRWTPPNGGLWVHTAGSMPMNVFAGTTGRFGVFYPMQTFSKGRPVVFASIPIFIEAQAEEDEQALREIAGRLSTAVHVLPSAQRQRLHLAAVFACSFTNRMYAVAFRLLEEQGLDGRLLLPLIDETAAKVHSLPPSQAQTGPAVRHDTAVMEGHLSMLEDTLLQSLYRLVSNSITQA